MTALCDADRDSSQRDFRRRQLQVEDLNAVAAFLPMPQPSGMAYAAQRAFKREVGAAGGEPFDFVQQKTSSFD